MTSDFFLVLSFIMTTFAKINVNDVLGCKDWLRYIKGGKDKNHC